MSQEWCHWERESSLRLGLAAGSFVEGQSVHRLEECIQVGKGEHSNKEPGVCQYAQGRLIMVSWVGSDKVEVTVVEDLCEGVVR